MPNNDEDEALFSEALRLRDSGEYVKSLEILGRLQKTRADSGALFAVTGHVHWELGQLDEAVRQFEKAIELAPRYTPASLGLFHCLWGQDKRVEALEEAKRFTALTGSDEYMEIVREINQSDDG